jgi:signal transduction histidine kinase
VQLTLDLILAIPYLIILILIVVGLMALPAAGSGVLILVPTLLVAAFAGIIERARVYAFVGVYVPPGNHPSPDEPLWRRLLLDARPWRATVHLTLMMFWGLIVGSVMTVLVCFSVALAALPLYHMEVQGSRIDLPLGQSVTASLSLTIIGYGGLVILPMVARGLVGVDLALARLFLGPRDDQQRVAELTERVETLRQTREMTVDSVELERRRIERDLHDGPQQRLVALAMDLGMAQQKLDDDPEAARKLLTKAHTAAKEAIIEMRQVARGIHPPVLTDRGLDAALSALAARSPVPVSVNVRLTRRPSATIESIAYFCVSEALTNVAKHAHARSVKVNVGPLRDGIRVDVADDGCGGVDPARGTGLSGLRQRLAAVDGSLEIDSPPGSGTRLTITLPDRTASGRRETAPAPATTSRSLT